MEKNNPKTEYSPMKDTKHGVFSLGKGLLLSATITGYIIGPLVIFGAIGFGIDKYFDTKPVATLSSLGLAFVSTNYLIYKQSDKLAEKFDDNRGL